MDRTKADNNDIPTSQSASNLSLPESVTPSESWSGELTRRFGTNRFSKILQIGTLGAERKSHLSVDLGGGGSWVQEMGDLLLFDISNQDRVSDTSYMVQLPTDPGQVTTSRHSGGTPATKTSVSELTGDENDKDDIDDYYLSNEEVNLLFEMAHKDQASHDSSSMTATSQSETSSPDPKVEGVHLPAQKLHGQTQSQDTAPEPEVVAALKSLRDEGEFRMKTMLASTGDSAYQVVPRQIGRALHHRVQTVYTLPVDNAVTSHQHHRPQSLLAVGDTWSALREQYLREMMQGLGEATSVEVQGCSDTVCAPPEEHKEEVDSESSQVESYSPIPVFDNSATARPTFAITEFDLAEFEFGFGPGPMVPDSPDFVAEQVTHLPPFHADELEYPAEYPEGRPTLDLVSEQEQIIAAFELESFLSREPTPSSLNPEVAEFVPLDFGNMAAAPTSGEDINGDPEQATAGQAPKTPSAKSVEKRAKGRAYRLALKSLYGQSMIDPQTLLPMPVNSATHDTQGTIPLEVTSSELSKDLPNQSIIANGEILKEYLTRMAGWNTTHAVGDSPSWTQGSGVDELDVDAEDLSKAKRQILAMQARTLAQRRQASEGNDFVSGEREEMDVSDI